MELPITRPSYVSYGDEVDFDKFLEKLARKRHNGFIRITHASSEGHILLKNGTPVAASYDRYMKSEAMKKILEIVDKIDTLIELFEVRGSQIDYLIDINKVYKLEPTPPKKLEEIPEAAKPTEKTPTKPEETPEITKETEKEEHTKITPTKPEETPEITKETEKEEHTKITPTKPEETPEITKETEKEEHTKITPTKPEETPEITKETEKEEHTKITPTKPEETPEITKETEKEEHTKITPTKPEETPEITKETEKEEHTKRPLNREEVMKKYGLADVDEEEVERVLETYKGGAMTTIDTEKVELTLMNKIKKSIIGIPNIKNVEVMVFLENVPELEGDIKVLIERESKGLLSRLIGGVMKEEELKEHIYDIIEMEIKKTFRGYPEIIEKFSVNIEIH